MPRLIHILRKLSTSIGQPHLICADFDAEVA
jgi:hypothetical protein